jgi:hypothetical protein
MRRREFTGEHRRLAGAGAARAAGKMHLEIELSICNLKSVFLQNETDFLHYNQALGAGW